MSGVFLINWLNICSRNFKIEMLIVNIIETVEKIFQGIYKKKQVVYVIH